MRKQKPHWKIPMGFLKNLAIPTFASALTIIGPKCLTTVFGMGTGVSTWVWSPEKCAGRSNPHALDDLVFCFLARVALRLPGLTPWGSPKLSFALIRLTWVR